VASPSLILGLRKIGTATVSPEVATSRAIDFSTVHLAGGVTFDDAALPEGLACETQWLSDRRPRGRMYGSWKMWFRNEATGEVFRKYLPGGSSYELDIYPGTYAVGFEIGYCRKIERDDRHAIIGERLLHHCARIQ
jgi:hypothetical protein